MLQENCKTDRIGGEFGKQYSLVVTDPFFERRLKSFDPRLKLMFDQVKRRWTILEWASDNSGWNIILTAEDDVTKEPKPLGEWIFNRLYVYRHRHEEKMKDPDIWFNNLLYEADYQARKIEAKSDEEGKYRLRHDYLQWRKVAKDWRQLPKLNTVNIDRQILMEENPNDPSLQCNS
jgi:hypothetical protein